MGPLEFGRLEADLGARLCRDCRFDGCVLRGLPDEAIDFCDTARARSQGAA